MEMTVFGYATLATVLVLAWIAARSMSLLHSQNRTLVAAVLTLTEKPAAVVQAARMETNDNAAEPSRLPSPEFFGRRPKAGAG